VPPAVNAPVRMIEVMSVRLFEIIRVSLH